MKRYVVRDAASKLHVIEVDGFVPDGHLGEAPAGATLADGQFISIVNGVPVLDTVAKAAAQAAIDAAIEEAKTLDANAKLASARLKALDIAADIDGATTLAQMKQILKKALPDIIAIARKG